MMCEKPNHEPPVDGVSGPLLVCAGQAPAPTRVNVMNKSQQEVVHPCDNEIDNSQHDQRCSVDLSAKSIDDDGAKTEWHRQQIHRKGLVICACLYTPFFVGAMFGWGPMQLLLEEQGFFSSQCQDETTDSNDVCPSQTAALINVNFIAQVTQVVSPILGHIADHYGPRVVAYMMAMAQCSGIFFLVVAVQWKIDFMLYFAFVSIALGTWMGALLIVQTGIFFQGKTRNRVIVSLNALFDAGAVSYLGLWAIGQATGSDLTRLITGYFAFALLVFGPAIYFWCNAIPEQAIDDNKLDASGVPQAMTENPLRSSRAQNESSIDATLPSRDFNTANDKLPVSLSLADAVHDASNLVVECDHSLHSDAAALPGVTMEASKIEQNCYVLVAHRSSLQQLLAWPTLGLFAFFSLQLLVNVWTLTTTRDFLAYLGDDDVNNRYLTIFTLLTPASLIALPFVATMLIRFGYYVGMQMVNLLALGHMVIRCASDNLNVQVLGFIIFSFYRCFLFGVVFSYLPSLLASNVVGKANGFMFLFGGLALFLNIPMSQLAVKTFDGDFFIPNLVYTALIIPCIPIAWGMGRSMKLESQARIAMKTQKLGAS